MGNPMPAQGRTDPGIRNQIFTSTYQNSDGYYALNVDFVTANVMVKCDGSWSSEVQDNFDQYVRGKYLAFQLDASKYLNVSQAQILNYRIWSSDPGNGHQVKWRLSWRLIKHKKSNKLFYPVSPLVGKMALTLKPRFQLCFPEKKVDQNLCRR